MSTEREFVQAAKQEGYSDEIIQQALRSEWLTGITMSYTETGEIDIPKRDWANALADATGKPVSAWMWD